MTRTILPKLLKEKILQRDEFVCKRCDTPQKRTNLIVHHIIRVIDGGNDNPDNLLTLCVDCHTKTHQKYNPSKWIKENQLTKERFIQAFSKEGLII